MIGQQMENMDGWVTCICSFLLQMPVCKLDENYNFGLIRQGWYDSGSHPELAVSYKQVGLQQ